MGPSRTAAATPVLVTMELSPCNFGLIKRSPRNGNGHVGDYINKAGLPARANSRVVSAKARLRRPTAGPAIASPPMLLMAGGLNPMRRKPATHSPARGIAREIERKLKEGRGKGSGRNYKPWICVTEISSRGRSHEIEGWKVGRTHHLLSDLERDAFYIFQWTQNITDIREQFPLPLKQTIAIARQLGVPHPGEQNYGTPIVITLDFLLSKIAANGKKLLEANDCKYTDDLDERSLEKLEIALNRKSIQTWLRICGSSTMPITMTTNSGRNTAEAAPAHNVSM